MNNQVPRKIVLRGEAAKKALLAGSETVHESVAATLGPRSENVALSRPWGGPSVVHDGVSVARELLPLADPFEDVGAQIVVDAAERTGDVGDGTTTATVLAFAIFKKAHAVITAGMPTMGVRTGIERAVGLVSARIHENAIPIKDDKEKLRQVALVSAQLQDIGDMVVKAVDKVGADGVITVEESTTTESMVEVKQGMELERGYKSHYFITDREAGEAVVENAAVLVTDQRISSMDDFIPVLNIAINEKGVKSLVVIADDVDGEPLATLIVNKVKGKFNALAVQAPNFGEKRHAILQDIAVLTGATLISEEAGMTLKEFKPEYLGTARAVKASDKTTIIVDGGGAKAAVEERAAEIKKQAEHPDVSEFDKEKLLERYAKLTTGVAVVHVGGRAEAEVKERKERAIDAISAVKAAVAEGIVPGGGTALLRGCDAIRDFKFEEGVDEAERAGFRIVLEACEAPYRRLLANAGVDPGESLKAILNDKAGTAGVDVKTGLLVDMLEAGIIDPAKVVRSALENAASAGVILSTISNIVVERPEDSKDVSAQY